MTRNCKAHGDQRVFAVTNNASTYSGILILSKLLVFTLKLLCNLIPFLLAAILDGSLYDSTSVMFENDVLDLASYYAHECVDVLSPILLGKILLAS